MRGRGALLAVLLPGLLLGCGEPSKSDLIEKARGVSTRERLREVLGEPQQLVKLGPLEKWTYLASDGEVSYLITGDSVALEFAGSQAAQ
jgi:hypothetical protein